MRIGLLGTPIEKLLKSVSGTPSTLGVPTKTPGIRFSPESNPSWASFTCVTPRGWLKGVSKRKYPKRNSFTVAEPKVLVSPRLTRSLHPSESMLNPGYVGLGDAQ